MGQRIIVAAKEAGCQISGALERPGHELVGQDAGLIAGCGALGVAISDDLNAVVAGCDVLIDFTTPKVSLKNLEVCSLKKKAIVIGSTGFTPEERLLAAELAKEIPAVLAPNMSVGVNVCFKVLKDVAAILGEDFDVEIVEAHHNSGSAACVARTDSGDPFQATTTVSNFALPLETSGTTMHGRPQVRTIWPSVPTLPSGDSPPHSSASRSCQLAACASACDR